MPQDKIVYPFLKMKHSCPESLRDTKGNFQMKRIFIVNTQIPFIHGGAEIQAQNLQRALTERAHKVEMARIPFIWYPPERIPEQILACRLLNLSESYGEKIDLLIGLKFPSYYIRHPNKVLWIVHQHRRTYDLWGTEYCDIPDDPAAQNIKEIITQSDNSYLREAKRIFTISKNVSNRLKKYNNLESIPLYPPVQNREGFFSVDFGEYVFFPSRISRIKRQGLAIESMRYVKSDVKLIIAGWPDSRHNLATLNNLITKFHLNGRVEILQGITDDEKINLYANSLGILFIPYDEDYGYVTVEAMYSRKPVITCTDSGGPLEFVEDNITGYIKEPDPREIADAIDSLYFEKERAKKLGQSGYEKIISMDISWDRVVDALIG